MVISSTLSCNSPEQGTLGKFYTLRFKAFLSFLILFTLLAANPVLAQTVGTSHLVCDISNRNPCTSNDLQVVSVAIDAPGCITCTGGTATFPLKMTIHNGTKSVRTSFALYGSLSSGATINGISGNIFICVGPITVKSDELLPGESAPGNQTFAVGTITFTCGQDLTLTNNFLAWTDASGTTTARCNTFSQADECSDIAPKCGFASSITIQGPVPAPSLVKVDPTCTVATGTVSAASTYSTTGLTFSLDGGAFAAYPTGGWSGLGSGQHCVRAKRTSDGCISNPACLTIGTVPANPDRPVVTLQEATICGNVTAPTVTVSCPIAGTYKLTQTGETDQTFAYNGSNGPVVFTIKPGLGGFGITVTNTDGCTSTATDCTNYTSNSCPSSVAKAAVQTIELAAPKTKVLAAPNPFTNRVRFKIESAVSGMGSLELYNTMGQKVATVYQGYVEAGKPLNKEYSVNRVSHNSLIYVFRVGDQKVTGKLLNW
jgi:hypothetical protein